jgi:hypothetical protein
VLIEESLQQHVEFKHPAPTLPAQALNVFEFFI